MMFQFAVTLLRDIFMQRKKNSDDFNACVSSKSSFPLFCVLNRVISKEKTGRKMQVNWVLECIPNKQQYDKEKLFLNNR